MTRRAQLRRRTVPAALIVLTAGLCSLAPAPQAAATALPSASLLSADGLHSCAISSGKAYCWGYGPDGALGDGSTANSDVPVAVDTSGVLADKTLTQITTGFDDTCVLDSAGAAYCWGNNHAGALGNGSETLSGVPVAVDTSGALAARHSPRAAPATTTPARWTAAARPTAGAITAPVNLATGTPSAPASRCRSTPAAYQPARLSPRSARATQTPVRWIPPVPRTAGDTTDLETSPTGAPAAAMCRWPSTQAAHSPARP